MADSKISALTAVTTPAGTDEFAVNQAGASKKETLAQVAAFATDPVVVVAANDSASAYKNRAGASLTGDGTADDVQIQAGWDALPSTGGTLYLAPGTYAIATTPLFDDNKRVRIVAYGAVFNLAASTTGMKIKQGISTSRGVTVEGLRVEGSDLSGTVGIELEDTNNSELVGVEVNNCAVGILLDSQAASNFVEGTRIENALLRDCTEGLKFAIGSGTGSFMQTRVRSTKIVVGTGGTALVIPSSALMLRSTLEIQMWIGSSEVGASLDGDFEDAVLDLSVEGAGGSTGNTAILVGSNATNLDQAFIRFLMTGTINTQLTNASSKVFRYWAGGSQMVSTTGTSILGFRRHGDSANRFQIEELTAGGRLSWGTGSAAVDANLYRSAANVLSSDDKLDPASFNNQVKAGTPVDGDVVGGAADGDQIWDSTGNYLWVRDGGAWVKAAAQEIADHLASAGHGAPTLIASGAAPASGAANTAAAPSETWLLNTADNGVTTVETVMSLTGLVAGTYLFEYFIVWRSGATGNGTSFAVDYTGTVTRIRTTRHYQSTGAAAATGVHDGVSAVLTGTLVEHMSANSDNGALGPTTGVASTTEDQFDYIRGIMVVSNGGNLDLTMTGEGGAAVTFKADSILLLKRLA